MKKIYNKIKTINVTTKPVVYDYPYSKEVENEYLNDLIYVCKDEEEYIESLNKVRESSEQYDKSIDSDSEVLNVKYRKVYISGGIFAFDEENVEKEIESIVYKEKKMDEINSTFSEVEVILPVEYIKRERKELLKNLKKHGIKRIIIDAISLSNITLAEYSCYFTYEDIKKAISRLKSYGFNVGINLVIGLEGKERSEIELIKEKLPKNIDTVIVSQNIVLKGTNIAKKFVRGEIDVLTNEEAKNLTEKVVENLIYKNIKNIYLRERLQESMTFKNYLTGPIVVDLLDEIQSRLYYTFITDSIAKLNAKIAKVLVTCQKGMGKYIRGKNDINSEKIEELYLTKLVIKEVEKVEPKTKCLIKKVARKLKTSRKTELERSLDNKGRILIQVETTK